MAWNLPVYRDIVSHTGLPKQDSFQAMRQFI